MPESVLHSVVSQTLYNLLRRKKQQYLPRRDKVRAYGARDRIIIQRHRRLPLSTDFSASILDYIAHPRAAAARGAEALGQEGPRRWGGAVVRAKVGEPVLVRVAVAERNEAVES
jgi:hypothetical protein